MRRFIAIWFRYLLTDWQTLRQPMLANQPFVFASPERGRMTITAVNAAAAAQGITPAMPLADAKALYPNLPVFNTPPEQEDILLQEIAEWCFRYTPFVVKEPPDGLILEVGGCTHLWDGEAPYLQDILTQIRGAGYDIHAVMADTAGAARAIARSGQTTIVAAGAQAAALAPLPPYTLQLEQALLLRLKKLGLHTIATFMHLPPAALLRRFGPELTRKLAQASGDETEPLQPLQLPPAYEERLPCLEPVLTATGISIAIQQLLDNLCPRLQAAGKGLRIAVLQCFRTDGVTLSVQTGTNRPSHHAGHLFKLFEHHIATIEPDPGIELFLLSAPAVEEMTTAQETLWATHPGLQHVKLAELLDRLEGRLGNGIIHRYLPAAHYWPERALTPANSVKDMPAIPWRTDRPRPTLLLTNPEPIEVTAPIPDYPPMLFRYKGQLHQVKKADGPERIEREWWLDGGGEHRDYYTVEDEAGRRYWLFRSGHYAAQQSQWFIHGFFA